MKTTKQIKTKQSKSSRKTKKAEPTAPTRDELVANEVAKQSAKTERLEMRIFVGALTISIEATAI